MDDMTALAEQVDKTYGYDSFVSHETLYELFGLAKPDENTLWGVAIDAQFKYLAATEKLKKALLENHKKLLANVRGDGYRVVEPSEQTNHAEKCGYRKVTKDLTEMQKSLMHIDHKKLSITESTKNHDALVRAGNMKIILAASAKNAKKAAGR